jgi:ribosomal protein S18 acetylase RimI-like enzyme
MASDLELHDGDVGQAAAVFAHAFHDDPFTAYMYPDENERRRLTPLMFDALVRYDRLFGQVDCLPGLAAVAAWARPDTGPETPERLARAGFDDLPGDVPLDRLDAVLSAVSEAAMRVAPEPHWHLHLIGVDPDQQRRGLGASLLRHGLARAGAAGRSCYLETFSQRTIRFYLRHGFDLVLDEIEPTSNLRYWGFLWQPTPDSSRRAQNHAANTPGSSP